MGWQDAPENGYSWVDAPEVPLPGYGNTVARQVHTPDGKVIWELGAEPGQAEDQPVDDTSGALATTTGLSSGISAGLIEPLAAAMGTVIPNGAETSIWQGKDGMRSFSDAYSLSRQQIKGLIGDLRQDHPGKFYGAEIAGSVASPLSRLVPGSTVGRSLANSALYGGIYGGATSDDPLEGAATGAAAGAAGDLLFRGAARVASPTVNAAVQRLKDAGVTMTPGQIAGGAIKRLEDSATSVPLLGDIIRNAQRKGLDSLQRASIDEALGPIGASLPKDVPTGREAVQWAQDAASRAYEEALLPLHIQPDDAFAEGMRDIMAGIDGLPDDIANEFRQQVSSHVTPYVGDTIDGHGLQDIYQGLNKRVSAYRRGAPRDEYLADGLEAVRDEFMNLADRAAPEQTGMFRQANAAYRNMAPVNRAAAKSRDTGTFTASQLASAVREADRSKNKRAFARGEAPMQELSDAAASVLPSSVPDSGTINRGIMAFLAGSGIGAGAILGHPTPLIAGGAAALPYLPGGRKATEWLMTGRQGVNAKRIREALDRIAPAAGVSAPMLLTGNE